MGYPYWNDEDICVIKVEDLYRFNKSKIGSIYFDYKLKKNYCCMLVLLYYYCDAL